MVNDTATSTGIPRLCAQPARLFQLFRVSRFKPGLSPSVNPVSSQGMHRDYHRWYSHRLNRDMGVAVYGHYGMPILAFPTSGGDEWEQEGQGMIGTLARTWSRGESESSPSTA